MRAAHPFMLLHGHQFRRHSKLQPHEATSGIEAGDADVLQLDGLKSGLCPFSNPQSRPHGIQLVLSEMAEHALQGAESGLHAIALWCAHLRAHCPWTRRALRHVHCEPRCVQGAAWLVSRTMGPQVVRRLKHVCFASGRPRMHQYQSA